MNEAVADILKNCVLCRGMSDEEVRALCESKMAAGTLQLRSINKGEYIFHEGASPRAMYILVSGRIGISRVTLSRELGKMQTEGLIRLEGRRIVVTDQDGLERYL